MGQIANRVRNIIVNILSVDESEVTINASLSDLGADELDVVEMVNEFTKGFGIPIQKEHVNFLINNTDISPVAFMYGAIIGPHLNKIIADKYDLDVNILMNAEDIDFLNIGDELDFVELIMEFEKYFKVTIPDDDAADIISKSDALFYLAERL